MIKGRSYFYCGIIIFDLILGGFMRIIIIIFIVLFSISAFAIEPVLQKAKTYSGNEDIAGWVMSEKLDGIRGVWDGKQLVTRKGNIIHAPSWFLKDFPPFELDGELWTTRDNFQQVQSIVLDKIPSKDWDQITYNIFEVPNTKGSFLHRLRKAEDWFKEHPNSYIKIIPQIFCKDIDHMHSFLDKIERQGGEGIILKDPTQDYHTGRTPYVLKVKRFEDMEGVIIGINPGKGAFDGIMGSLTLQLENGVIFKIGTGFNLDERKNPLLIGTVVTFKYQGFTKKGKPRFASFLRVRKD